MDSQAQKDQEAILSEAIAEAIAENNKVEVVEKEVVEIPEEAEKGDVIPDRNKV